MSQNIRILVIEDEKNIQNFITSVLNSQHYQVISSLTGRDGLSQAASASPDLILLDLGLPDMDGMEIIRKIREWSDTPILVISARVQEDDKVLALDSGADDYITKPFSMEELTFRIEAILRRVRGKKNKESNIYKIGKFTFDTQKQILATEGKQTKLTTKESELLGLLCAHANEILQRDFALKTIWIDDNYFNARSMDVYITKLRKHLKEDDSIEIINIHGKGYKLITPEVES